MRSKPPCRPDGVPCKDRFPACQDVCPKMLKWQETEGKRKQARYDAKELEWITYSERAKKAEIKKQKEGRK